MGNVGNKEEMKDRVTGTGRETEDTRVDERERGEGGDKTHKRIF